MQDVTLTNRELCDLECILLGAYNPLKGFLRERDYLSVLRNMRLSTGELWSLPITLSINKRDMERLKGQENIILKDIQGITMAELCNVEIYKPNPEEEVISVYGSKDDNHPDIKYLLREEEYWYVGGEIKVILLPPHYDFLDYRLSASETIEWLKENKWKTIVGFQTRNPMHKSHFYLTKYALEMAGEDAKLLLTPAVGQTQSCDVDYSTRVKGYISLLKYYGIDTAKLVILPLAMRMAGPREALLHAIVRKNYGCTHFVIGRDHAGPSYKKKNGENYFEPYQAQDLVNSFIDELKIKIITSKQISFVPSLNKYLPSEKIPAGIEICNISGTQQRTMLENGEILPEWFTFPEIYQILSKRYPPKYKRGLCIYIVGLSGSGKSTFANYLVQKLSETCDKPVTLLDGDIVRTNLSKGLGFSKQDRSTNVRRVGWTAQQIVKHRGIVVCSTIAPYQQDRDYNKSLIEEWGNYVEIWMNTPLNICEQRDIKGLYKLARQGKINNFTGINDPFEMPKSDLTLTGEHFDNINENIQSVMNYLYDKNFLKPMAK